MISLNQKEQEIAAKIKKLKDEAGTHSPSIFTVAEKIPELKIHVDACFLSNPYATELFFTYLKRDLVDSRKMRDVLEFYPSQNNVIAEILSECLNVNPKSIFIGNGAIEIIQAVIHNFTKNKIIVNIPTFSSYYEFVKDGIEILFNPLEKGENYRLNIEKYIQIVKKEKPDTIVIINPNNPDGGYVKYSDIKYLLANLTEVETVIIDESFIHFAYEDETYEMKSATELVKDYPNLIVIKSMSKDFGIAGVRAGYAVMDSKRVAYLLKNGFLWNSSGLAEYFFRLYVHDTFLKEYEKVRIKYIQETQLFFKELSTIPQIQLYPGLANFGLIELKDGSTSTDFVSKLLIGHGIYTRNCADKIGLEGQFVRIASRNKDENALIINSIKICFE
ncbi:MAG: histidinol-phosphate aminotransferase family protein [Bacteroidetes bacterium]|nr:histidinol-phosphate aminotransferase family protein [Bacteroidota bacterium]